MENKRINQLIDFLKDNAEDTFLNYALSLEYVKENRKAEAILLLQNIINRNENYLPAYYQLARLLENKNKDESIAVYKKGIVVAKRNNDLKTLNELKEAYFIFTDEDI